MNFQIKLRNKRWETINSALLKSIFHFYSSCPSSFFLHDVTNSPIARRCVRRNGQVVPKNQGAAGSGASRRPKTHFFSIYFYFWGLGARLGRHLPQALTRWLWRPWLHATSLFFFFSYTFFTLNNVTYQAIVKFSFQFLAASIPPSTSSVFPFGRQAKVQQCESTIKLWTGSSLSSTKSETKGGKYEVNDVIFCPSSSHSSTNKHRMSEILPESIRPMNKTPNISSFHSISAQLSPSTNEQKNW